MEKKYWSDWFSHNIPVWEQLFKKQGLVGTHFLNFLEIGCFEGRATNYLLENVLTGNGCKIHVIDIFSDLLEESGQKSDSNYDFSKMYENFVHNTQEHSDRIVIHNGPSERILKTDFQNNSFDFIYIDGSHATPDVLQDAILCHPLLKVGGLMLFDDYLWVDTSDPNPNNPDPTRNPRMGIDFFYNAYRHKYEIIHYGYQVCLLKTSN